MATTHMNGGTSPTFPLTTLISVYMTKTAPMPTVILNVRGIRTNVNSAGNPSSKSSKVDPFDETHHQESHEDQNRSSCLRRNHSGQGLQEDGKEEQDSDDD